MTAGLLTIREMCDAFEVTPRTLRFYEAKELLSPLRQGAKRLYDRKDRARLKLILRGKRFGFSLEEIRQVLNLYERDGSNLAQMERTYDLALDRLRVMEAQRDELEIAIRELKAELEAGAGMIAGTRKAAE
ncbi:MerR family transcriptional regulator [Pseudogemmobacter faecipullorum]|uniref:MerR family DNA-binding transcriptional regulator n=1 Tax=Pseudogemmobacter faecipullorum TaxID=2755041 RepID=A0ABS8CHY4_9RHOB|nr:MerR family DNA-binding transcriptional regulator [Pseudogemmobacter faecipullorum]